MSASYPNIDAPKGFIPTRLFSGGSYDGRHQLYLIPASDGTAVFVGDVVKSNNIAAAAGVFVNGMNCEGMPTAIRAASGTVGQDLVGVVTGFLPDPTNLGTKYRVASTNRIALVAPLHDVVYEIQEDADTTPLAAADIGLNISFTTTAGSTATGVSGMELDSSAKAATATLPLRILGLVQRVDNSFNTLGSTLDPAKFEVLFNTYFHAPNIVGIA